EDGTRLEQFVHRDHRSSSASGNDRWRRGGTRKFWRCVVRSTELKPWARERGESGSLTPPGSTPSIASRPRLKSSLVGLKTTKWTPAIGCASGTAGNENGLSSV